MTDAEVNAEVRALFAEDTRGFLSRMGVAASLLVDAHALVPKAFQSLRATHPFESIEDAAQSIRGSASSIDADFLAESASYVEELARRGANALASATAHAQRAHAMAAFCNDAMREMNAMLALYVEEAPEEASWLAMELRERRAEAKKVDDEEVFRLANVEARGAHMAETYRPPVLEGTDAVGNLDGVAGNARTDDGNATTFMPVEEFGFDAFDETSQPPPLARVFQDEAREIMVALKGHVESFLRTRAVSTLTFIDPLLHSLKGAAASVELRYLSTQADEAISSAAELRRSEMREGVPAFLLAVNRLLAAFAIPPVDEDQDHRVSPPSGVDVPEVFLVEAHEVLVSAEAIAEQLSRALTKREAVAVLADQAAKLFHRLKGTSLVVGAARLGDEANAVMLACKNLGNPATLATAIREGCARMRTLLAETASPFAFDEPAVPLAMSPQASLRPSEPPNFVTDGLRSIFREEILEMVGPINVALEQLDATPGELQALEALHRSFHTLKGTAASVGQMEMSSYAAAVEDLLDEAIEGEAQLDASFVEKVRVGARAALAVLGLESALVEPLEELSDADLVVDEASGGLTDEAVAASVGAAPEAVLSDRSAVPPMTAEEWDDLVANCAKGVAVALEIPGQGNAPVDELAAIFAEEVEQLAPTIGEAFDQLERDPLEVGAARALERFFHTLKGSAATVDRADLSSTAELLRSALEAVTNGVLLTASRVAALRAVSDQFLLVATRPAPRQLSGALAPEVSFAFEETTHDSDSRTKSELLEIFQQEAREALIALQGHTETLIATPSSVYAAEYIERLFHTLKGAAATVGLVEISAKAANLQASMGQVVTNKRVPDATFINELVSSTNELLLAIGVAPLVFRQNDSGALSSGPSADDSIDDIERRIFSGEVKSICRQASANVRALLEARDAESSVKKRAEIADLFHRLKGTAATVGAHVIAEEAARANVIAQGKASPREIANLVRAVIVRIADLAGFERVQPRKDRGGGGIQRENVVVPEDAELWESFDQECTEILDSLDKASFTLEEVAQPKVVLEEVFRLIHTLKGAVNTVGLSPTGNVLHITEDFLEELVKSPIMPPMRTVAGILIDVCKDVRQNLRTAKSGWVETSLGGFAARTASAMRPGSSSHRGSPERGSAPATGSLQSIFDSAALFGTAAIHDQGASGTGSRAGKSEKGDKSDSASANEGTTPEERAYIRVATTRLDALMNLAGELVVSRSRMVNRVGTLRFLYSELGRSRIRLTDTVETFRDQYEFANIGGKASRALPQHVVHASASSRGNAANANGTEMTLGSRAGGPAVFGELELDEYGDIHVLSRSLAEIGNDFEEAFRTLSVELSSFAEDADSLGGIISGIQGEVTRARMVPLDAVFARLRFPVRDAATREAKDVNVVTEGADVTIDKTIADAILQPMLHLVRNSVAHGIESPSRRASLGKDKFGTIRLVARQESGQIVIEVTDDGAGLDLAALRARGVSRGLLAADVAESDPRVRELVFASGLSTRDVASDIAGRGVGGEVVKRTIERLNGAIRIETTRGKGTSFVITLPLTLAITRALLVREGEATYAVPLYFAERILDTAALDIVVTGRERRVLLDGAFTRIRRLGEYFGDSQIRSGGDGSALVLRVGDDRMVLQLDAVLGQEEIVVKRAGELLEDHPLFAGVTLRGSGELVLIVDVPGLLGEFTRTRATTALQEHVQPRLTDDVSGPTLGFPIEVMVAPAPKARSPRSDPRLKLKAPKSRLEVAGAPEPLRLPEAAANFALKARQAVGSPAASGLAGVRVLVVDDSLSVRKVAEAHLRAIGLEVVVAVDGVDGLAKLREGRFDFVFTDLEMPRMHGYDFIRQLRMLAAYQDLPIVVVSSRSGQKHQEHARSLGATDYITKPFSAQSLEATVRRWLRR